QRKASLGNGFKHWQQFADVAELLVDQQQQRAVKLGHHRARHINVVGGQVDTVEPHIFDDGQIIPPARTSLDGDHAFLAHALHGLGDDVTDGIVGVGGDGAYLSDGLGVGAWLGQILQLVDNGDGGLVDTALEVHRVHAGGNGLQAFVDDGLGQYGSGGGAVTGFVVGLGGNVLEQLSAHVLELVLQLDFLGDGN